MPNRICVIAGASHAGAQLALSMRQRGWEGRILMVGEEAALPYHGPLLSNDSGPVAISSGGIGLYVTTPQGRQIRFANVYPDARYVNDDGLIRFLIPFELAKYPYDIVVRRE